MSKSEFLTCQRVLSITVITGFMIHHMLRVNIAIAIVEMVAKNSSNMGPHFSWNEEEKNNVLGCFFWGYVITQIPGGRLSEKFGTKIVVGVGLAAASIFTLLTPIASQCGYYWLIATRFGLGVAIGIQWPSTAPLASRWVPAAGTSAFMSHMAASSLGVALTLPTCGYLITYWGWPSVFYTTGSIAAIWTISWFYLVYDTPEQHPRISKDEKEKLRRKLKVVDVDFSVKKPSAPWRKILTSGPVWAIIVANTCTSCTFFIAFNQLPTYMSDVLHFNIKQNGWFSSLPYLARYCAAVTFSIAADKFLKRGTFSTTTVRKFCSVFLFAGTSCLFTVQSFWGYNAVISVMVFTSSLALIGLTSPGFYANAIDLAPAYSGTIVGISQVPCAITGYLTTIFVAMLTKEEQSFKQWTYVFWMLVAVNLSSSIFCYICISGKEQSWSWRSNEREMENLKNADTNEKIMLNN